MKNKILFSFLAIAMLAMFIAPSSANAQQRNMTIVTNNPEFSVKVKSCAASGKTIIITLMLENLGTNDVVVDFNNGGAYDDQGNFYQVSTKFTNEENYTKWSPGWTLLPEVPAKLQVKMEGVPVDVENIPRLQLRIRCSVWGLSDEKPVTIRNIPVTRQ